MLVIAVLLQLSVLSGVAAAEAVPSTQALGDSAVALQYMSGGANAAAVCMVDTGVNLTPDTSSAVIDRAAIDGGSPDDIDPERHGTLMAMAMAAPRNGWGMVGLWPAVRIVSIRALLGGYWVRGISECRQRATADNIKVISIAAGISGITPADDSQMTNEIDRARTAGLNVVAAAGNGGGALDAPANYPPVFAVGAVDANGAFCTYPNWASARGPELDIVATGCEMSLALPDSGLPATGGGTSEAESDVAVELAALRASRPDLSNDQAEDLLRTSATPTIAGTGRIDVEAAFRAAGLGVQWDAAASRAAAQGQAHGDPGVYSVTPNARSAIRRALPRPRIVSVRRHGARITVRIANRPGHTVVAVSVVEHRGRRTVKTTIRRSSATLTLRAAATAQVRAWFELAHRRSPMTSVRVPISSAYLARMRS